LKKSIRRSFSTSSKYFHLTFSEDSGGMKAVLGEGLKDAFKRGSVMTPRATGEKKTLFSRKRSVSIGRNPV
jgi:hypothetical protein